MKYRELSCYMHLIAYDIATYIVSDFCTGKAGKTKKGSVNKIRNFKIKVSKCTEFPTAAPHLGSKCVIMEFF